MAASTLRAVGETVTGSSKGAHVDEGESPCVDPGSGFGGLRHRLRYRLDNLLAKGTSTANLRLQLRSGDNHAMRAVVDRTDAYLESNPLPAGVVAEWRVRAT